MSKRLEEFEPVVHGVAGDCDCCCPRCGQPREAYDASRGLYAYCGDCYGGADVSFESALAAWCRRTDSTHPANVDARRVK